MRPFDTDIQLQVMSIMHYSKATSNPARQTHTNTLTKVFMVSSNSDALSPAGDPGRFVSSIHGLTGRFYENVFPQLKARIL